MVHLEEVPSGTQQASNRLENGVLEELDEDAAEKHNETNTAATVNANSKK